MPDQPTSKVARDAAVSSFVSNAVGMLLTVGVVVLLTRREWVMQQAIRMRAAASREWRGWHTNREVADFNRQVSEYEHEAKKDGGCGCS